MPLLERLIAIVAPHECLHCRAEGSVLCAACAGLLPAEPGRCYRCGRLDEANRTCRSCRSSTALASVWAATAYEDEAKALIGRLKFERARAAAADMAQLMAERLELNTDGLIVAYVPTANSRVRMRGYDQAQLLARELAATLGLPQAALLARTRDVRQLGAGRALRRVQLQDAFRPLKPHLVQNTNVLLVDDVITTGSTLEAAAKTLRAAGAKTVHAAVFARA